MIHYILVRRDLPFGVTLAQVAHAAANSMNAWTKQEAYVDSGYQHYDDYYGCDGWHTIEGPYSDGQTVVVLGVKNQRVLKNWEKKIRKSKKPFVLVNEPDAPWNGELMAIGMYPGERDKLSPLFKKLATYTSYGVGNVK